MRVLMHTKLANAERSAQPGQVIDVDPEDGKALVDGGYAEEVVDEPEPEPAPEPEPEPEGEEFPVHRGAGWYELSDGSTVRGKDEAQQAEAELSEA